jgi:hypothetical protein
MEQQPRAAGGLFILLGFVLGIVLGARAGQVIFGAIGGIAVGILLACLVWWRDSRR